MLPSAPMTFPSLQWTGEFWKGEGVLRAWAGFRNPAENDDPSDGSFRLVVSGGAGAPEPTEEQARAYLWLKEREAAIAAVVLADVFEAYPHEREQVLHDLDVPEGEENDVLPEIESPQELRDLMELRTVHVMDWTRDGLAYVGLVFGCAWDGEGWGVLLHGDRIVGGGFGDTAFDALVAKADGGKPIETLHLDAN